MSTATPPDLTAPSAEPPPPSPPPAPVQPIPAQPPAPVARPIDGRDDTTWPQHGLGYLYAEDEDTYLARLDLPIDLEDVREAVGGGRFKLAFLSPRPERRWIGSCWVQLEGPDLRAQLRAQAGADTAPKRRGLVDQLRVAAQAPATPPASDALAVVVQQLVAGQERLAEAIARIGQPAPPVAMRDRLTDKLMERAFDQMLNPSPAREELDVERVSRLKKALDGMGNGSEDLVTVMNLMQGFMRPQDGGQPRQEKKRLGGTGAGQKKRGSSPGAAAQQSSPAASASSQAPAAGAAPASPPEQPAAGGTPQHETAGETGPAAPTGVTDEVLEQLAGAKGGIVAFETLQGILADVEGDLDEAGRAEAVENVAVLASRLMPDEYLDQAKNNKRDVVAEFTLMQVGTSFPGNEEALKDPKAKAFVLDVLALMFDDVPDADEGSLS